MESAGRLLDRVCSVFFNLNSSHTNEELEAIARDYSPKLAQYNAKISLNPALFARVSALYAKRDELGLETDQMRLLERSYLGFVRSGAALDEDAKLRMAAISERMATLTTLFGQHVQADEQSWQLVLEEADLDGLPDYVREAAAQAASERGLEGRYVITLLRSSVEPFLTFSTHRDLREKAYKAWTGRGANGGDTDNHDLIREIVALRAEQSRLLGYATYADYKLDDTMAKEPAAVLNLLHQVWEPARAQALAERDLIQTEASHGGLPRRHRGLGLALLRRAGAEGPLRSRRCGDQALLPARKHGPRHVRHGHQAVRRQLWRDLRSADSITRTPRSTRCADSATDGHVGMFLHDNFARSSKRSGAWMSEYR